MRLLYFASVSPGTGGLAALKIVAMQAAKMRLHRAGGGQGVAAAVLERISHSFGSRVDLHQDGMLALRLAASKTGTTVLMT